MPRDVYFTPRLKSQLTKTYGLHLTDEGFTQCHQVCKSHDADQLACAAVGLDLRKLSKGSFPNVISNPSPSDEGVVLDGPFYLQVVSCKNIAQPSISQHANANSRTRYLYLQVTDGATKAAAVEHHHVAKLSLDKLPPGTKLVLRHVPFQRGMLLLDPR